MVGFPLEKEAMGKRSVLWRQKLQGSIGEFGDDAHGFHPNPF